MRRFGARAAAAPRGCVTAVIPSHGTLNGGKCNSGPQSGEWIHQKPLVCARFLVVLSPPSHDFKLSFVSTVYYTVQGTDCLLQAHPVVPWHRDRLVDYAPTLPACLHGATLVMAQGTGCERRAVPTRSPRNIPKLDAHDGILRTQHRIDAGRRAQMLLPLDALLSF